MFRMKTILILAFFFYSALCNCQTDTMNIERANELYGEGKSDSAMLLLSNVIKKYPNEFHAYLYRGEYYCLKKEDKLGYEDFIRAYQLDSLDPTVNGYLGWYFDKRGKYKKALFYYDKSIRLDPEYPETYAWRGVLYMNIRKYREAEADLLYAASDTATSKQDHTYLNLGCLYSYHLKKYAKAIEYLNMYISVAPNDRDAYKARANAYFMLNEFAKYKEDRHKQKQLK